VRAKPVAMPMMREDEADEAAFDEEEDDIEAEDRE
jgi:hypothetical protein